MVLTAVSSAWPQNGRHASQPSWRNVHRTRHALSCRVEPKRYRSGSVRQRPTGRRPLSLQPEKRKPPVGCGSPGRRQSRSLRQQSHSTRVVVGVEILWHASAHKGRPLVHRRAPAPNTVNRKGSPDGWREEPAIRGRFAADASTVTRRMRGARDSARNGLPALGASEARQGAHTVQKVLRAGCPAGLRGGLPHHRHRADMATEFMAFQDARRGPDLPDAGRLPLSDSTGNVPLQSG